MVSRVRPDGRPPSKTARSSPIHVLTTLTLFKFTVPVTVIPPMSHGSQQDREFKGTLLRHDLRLFTAFCSTKVSMYYQQTTIVHSVTRWSIGNKLGQWSRGCRLTLCNDPGKGVCIQTSLPPSSVILYQHKLGRIRQVYPRAGPLSRTFGVHPYPAQRLSERNRHLPYISHGIWELYFTSSRFTLSHYFIT